MKPKTIEKNVEKIENDNWDELNIVLEVEPEYISDEYLLELKKKWKKQQEKVDKMFKGLIRLVAISPVWFVIGLTSIMLTEGFFLSNIIFLFPLSVFIFVLGMVYISVRFGGKTKQKEIGRIIHEEINRRIVERRKNWFL